MILTKFGLKNAEFSQKSLKLETLLISPYENTITIKYKRDGEETSIEDQNRWRGDLMKPLGLSGEVTSDNVVSTQKIHGECLKITSTDTELVFLKNLPIFVVFFCGLVFVYGKTLANLVLFYYMIEHD